MAPHQADVVVLGLGPAGRAVAHRAARHGLTVTAIDPHPHRRWTPTYAAWADELPGWLPEAAIAATVPAPSVYTTREVRVPRAYCILDTPALQDGLGLGPVRVVAARAVRAGGDRVILDDGSTVRARAVVDARGTSPNPGVPHQTAFGLVLPAETAAPALAGQRAWIMDWRRDNGARAGEPASFLYAVPLGGGNYLLEETCLAGRPALSLRVLEQRLRHRLHRRGVTLSGHERSERVRFALLPPRSAGTGSSPVAFGSRAGLMHPGTGYSVAASLATADRLVGALAGHTRPDRAVRPVPARAVHALHSIGLRVLLRLDPDRIPDFFDSFFALPVSRQRAYLSEWDTLSGTVCAMRAVFAAAPADIRRVILGSLVPLPR